MGHRLFRLGPTLKWVKTLVLLIPFALFSDHLLAQSADSKQTAEATTETRLLILGDSLSAGYGLLQAQSWVSLLQNIWNEQQRGIEVINAAISGETTDGGLARLPRLLTQHNPTHVLVELGGNDGLQGHNVTKLQQNLTQIVQLAKQHGAKVFLQDMQIPTNYGRRYNQMFSNSFKQVAQSEGIPLIPFFLEDIALNEALMQRDGIHPNAEGQPLIAEFMAKQLTPYLDESSQH
ncbi:arylesterase [Alteromonas lipolytica]|uniref:Arylesterase n=1 Tax=Alteromonas lipolytica TaxID=1856405 RepID=A0A1E8FEQ2_9ALTE|nr:arylesterase [Alteromonas lipolytica]